MTRAGNFLTSSIGKKLVMGVSGAVLLGFVVGHMLGNLQVYLGPEAFNGYAEGLRKLPALLWAARGVLLAALVVHLWAAYSLTMANRRARRVGYRETAPQASTYASRTMRWGGVTLLLFVIYHLLHFTFGVRAVHPRFQSGDVYHNFVTGFQQPLVSLFYVLAMLALGFHLYHGAWSMLQTLGLSHPRYDHLRKGFAALLTTVVVAANISFPVAVMLGVLREASRGAPTHRAVTAR